MARRLERCTLRRDGAIAASVAGSPRSSRPHGTERIGRAASRVPLADIRPNPDQPRAHVRREELSARSPTSIAEHGVLQPILVVARGRRLRLIAASAACARRARPGSITIPAVVRTANEQEQPRARARREPPARRTSTRSTRRAPSSSSSTSSASRRSRSAGACRRVTAADRQHAAPARARAGGPGGRRGGRRSAEATRAPSPGSTTTRVQVALLAVVVARGLSVRQTERLVADRRDDRRLDARAATGRGTGRPGRRAPGGPHARGARHEGDDHAGPHAAAASRSPGTTMTTWRAWSSA